jgi:hypothetical protein
MTVSDPVHVVQAEPSSTIDREARLPPVAAVAAIAVLAVLCWSVVILAAIGLCAAF